MSDEVLTEEEKNMLKDAMGYGSPTPEEKHNVHTFLNKVSTSKDTTKTGNLTHEEVGMPNLPIRSLQELALISGKIMDNKFFQDYFMAESEIITSSSLSKDAKLINLAVITKREIADVTPVPRKENKGWFQKKDKPADGAQQ
jgi:hypothetical protein